MNCTHDIVECERAVFNDGYCPICQAAEIAKLRASLEDLLAFHEEGRVPSSEAINRGYAALADEQKP